MPRERHYINNLQRQFLDRIIARFLDTYGRFYEQGHTLASLRTPDRHNATVRARLHLIWILRLCSVGVKDIAEILNRHHTTISDSAQAHRAMMDIYPGYRATAARIMAETIGEEGSTQHEYSTSTYQGLPKREYMPLARPED